MAQIYTDENNVEHEFPDDATAQEIDAATKSLGSSKKDQGTFAPVEFNPSFSEKLAPNIVSGAATGARNLLNIPYNLAKFSGNSSVGSMLGIKPENVPHVKEVDYSKALKLPESASLSDNLVRGLTQYAPSFALGRAPLGVAGKAISRIPKVGGLLENLTANAIPQSLFSMSQNPDDALKSGERAGEATLPFTAASQAITSSNPIFRALGRLGIAGAGAYGGYKGAKSLGADSTVADIVAAVTGGGLSMLGKNSSSLARDNVLKGVDPSVIQSKLDAGKRLGLSYLTPAEVAENPFVAGTQGSLGKTEKGAQLFYKKGEDRISSEKKAIEDLNEKISPEDKLSSFEVRKSLQDSIKSMKDTRQSLVKPFYEIAHSKKIAPNMVTSISSKDSNIRNAIKEALSDPKYQVEGELLGVPRNSVKVLDYAKRKIDSKIEQAKNFGDNDAVRVLTDSKEKLLNHLDKISPDYKKARSVYNQLSKPIEELENSQVGRISELSDTNLKDVSKIIFDPSQTDLNVLRTIKKNVQQQNPKAWDLIVKNEINRLISQGKDKKINGSNFYDKVLSNPTRFKQLQVALEHNPKALQHLNDMKEVFPHLLNPITSKTAAGLAKTNMSSPRNTSDRISDFLKDKFTSGKYDEAAVDLMTSPTWEKELGNAGKQSELARKIAKGINLAGKATASYAGSRGN